jgi:hypothetical protein
MISILSTASSRALHIGVCNGGYFPVALVGYPVEATTEVWNEPDSHGLATFLESLGAQQSPWVGDLNWSSLDGEITLSVRCTALGSVTFKVVLSGMLGAPEAWTVSAGLEAGFGDLERIALSAKGLSSGAE